MHKHPKLPSLGLSLADALDLEDALETELLNLLAEHREAMIAAMRGSMPDPDD